MDTPLNEAGITGLLADLRSGDANRRWRAVVNLTRAKALSDKRLVTALEVVRKSDPVLKLRDRAGAILGDAAHAGSGAGSEPDQSEAVPAAWTCSLCGASNAAADLQCVQCTLPRTLSQPHKQSAVVSRPAGETRGTAQAPEPVPPAPGWACSLCGSLNGETEPQCSKCGLPRSLSQPHKQAAEGPPSAERTRDSTEPAEPAPHPMGWTCSSCGSHNPETERRCLGCGTSHGLTRPAENADVVREPAEVAGDATQAAEPAPPPGGWTCSACGSYNPADDPACPQCGAFRSRSRVSASGGAPAGEAERPEVSPVPEGEQVVIMEGSWKCTECGAPNDASDLNCRECRWSRMDSRPDSEEAPVSPFSEAGSTPPSQAKGASPQSTLWITAALGLMVLFVFGWTPVGVVFLFLLLLGIVVVGAVKKRP